MKELISKDIIDNVKVKLVARHETLAVAESVTSGLLQSLFSAATDASKFFQGGITTYNIGQKVLHLGIEPIHAEECNCVSKQTASQMALGVSELFRSDWGIGITGYASVVPESGNQLFAYCAITYKGEVVIEKTIQPKATEFFPVQHEFAVEVVLLFHEHLKKDKLRT